MSLHEAEAIAILCVGACLLFYAWVGAWFGKRLLKWALSRHKHELPPGASTPPG